MIKKLSRLKDHFKESQLYLNRTVAAMVMVILCLGLIIARLIFLQIYEHDLYKTLSFNNQIHIDPITPARGLIFDRNGIIIAENVPAFSLEITPEHVDDLKETVAELQKIIPISEAEQQSFFKQLKYKRRFEGIPIRIKLTEEEVAKLSLEKYRFTGVDVVAHLIRHYPLGEPLAHVLGYIGPISEKDLEIIDPAQYRGIYYIGKTGLEKYYEQDIRGFVGYQHIETNAKGRTIRVLNRIPPKAGQNLHLSLDSTLQVQAYEALGEHKGSIVAIDPNNGEILALVSKPSFDPNLFAQGVDSKTYQAWQHSPDRPLYNRAILGTYPPGSTIKPFIALQALDLCVINPQYGIFDPGWFQLSSNGRLYRDMIFNKTGHGHGWVNLEKAIVCSCDTYFYNLANKLGISTLHHIFIQFGLGKATGIDLPNEANGIAPSVEWKRRVRKEDWYAGDTINIGIGQGLLSVTPLQMAHAVAIIASEGKRYKPHLVRGQSFDHTPIPMPENSPESTLSLKHPEYWQTIISAMQKVAHQPGGTAYRANQGVRYQLAGKTGTAQVFSLKQNEKYEAHKVKAHLRDHSWFIAFAPVEEPKIAIAVLVENKQHTSGADVARIVLDNFFNVSQAKVASQDIQDINAASSRSGVYKQSLSTHPSAANENRSNQLSPDASNTTNSTTRSSTSSSTSNEVKTRKHNFRFSRTQDRKKAELSEAEEYEYNVEE